MTHVLPLSLCRVVPPPTAQVKNAEHHFDEPGVALRFSGNGE